MSRPSRKALILEEAKKMFARRGYAATIMDDLAKEAGVNKATIYYHFKDKATLCETLFFEAITQIADRSFPVPTPSTLHMNSSTPMSPPLRRYSTADPM